MCFSAQASFTASAFLALIGTLALIKARHHRSLMLFAAIPLLFAIQQCCEGIIWVTNASNPTGFLHSVATHIYLIFAHLLWPLWTPISIIIPEKVRWRRLLCYTALLTGICFVLYLITQMYHMGFWARTANGHILYPYYGASHELNAVSCLYLYSLAMPLLVSSLPYTRLIAVICASSLVFSNARYPENLTSTWCFFAAIISSIIVLTIKSKIKQKH